MFFLPHSGSNKLYAFFCKSKALCRLSDVTTPTAVPWKKNKNDESERVQKNETNKKAESGVVLCIIMFEVIFFFLPS